MWEGLGQGFLVEFPEEASTGMLRDIEG